ncbi:hypothetical protein LTR36_002869 [Oleoguttula mirabilis]|uniref:Uncharacterized protein n=1 Tax=Oleoguttula mirabilis TaxID=1507867 RepID=A0AAV9JJD5_9PEZI|nr:hypothetical protein LTR36_002869 [Oleoguttula mirabilis]
MPGYADQVSVFHFTNRISSAKIRKYKMATERGMNNGPGQRPSSNTPTSGPVVTPAPQVEPAGTLMTMGPPPTPSAASEEPPAKKPKLKLTVRNPDASPAPTPTPAPVSAPGPSPAPVGDTIAVARPRRNSGLRIRYSENMVLEDESLRRASLESSELSSLEATPPPSKKPASRKEPTPNSANPDYGDFMSYYILDGDEDKPKAGAAKAPRKPRQQGPSQPQHQARAQQQMQAQRDAQLNNHMRQTQNYPPVQHRPPPPPPPPLPQVQLIDFDQFSRPDGPREPDTVLQMVQKLEALSTALTNFGGVPAVPKSPKAEMKAPPVQVEAKKDNPLDSFLGMFDDDDEESEGEDKQPEENVQQKLDYKLRIPGESDGPLSYGIQFIQNALKSWAQQRLQHQFAPQLQQQAQQWQQQQLQQQKRGPGRPRKFPDDVDPDRASQPALPPPLQIRADSTPEGLAIKAFQHVLESGCLQVNGMLPQELTGALRHLYMQIDHLINQGAKSEPQWQCMSYAAQIAANKVRVDKWRDSQAKAQEEMARQTQLAQQQVMQQMGLPTQQPGQLTSTQAQHAHAVELERRRSAQHAAQQPYLSQHHLNPLLLGSQPPGTPAGFAPSQSPVNGNQHGSRAPTPNGAASTPNGVPSSPANSNSQQHMEKVKMYMPGFMPRTGAQMKFSFAPKSDQAVKLFGSQAFPTGEPQGPNIPNRGPMSATPDRGPDSLAMSLDGAADSPIVRPSIESVTGQTNGEAHQANGEMVEETAREAAETMDDVEMAEADTVPVKKEAQTPAPIHTGGFTAVNAPQRPVAIPAGSPIERSPDGTANALGSSAATVSKINGQSGAADMAARFPHPGAVVVDQ